MSDKRYGATEYRLRAKRCADAVARSEQMERDFIEGKALNAHANEAMNAARLEKSLFSMWLFENHEALFSESGLRSAVIDECAAEVLRLNDEGEDMPLNLVADAIIDLKNAAPDQLAGAGKPIADDHIAGAGKKGAP